MSNEPQFTAGPWEPGHLGGDGKCQCAYVFSEGYAGGICTVHIDNGKIVGEGGNDAPPRSEAIGNMHLIAAAPELLAALVECLREHGGFTIKGDCERMARAAIAKASRSDGYGREPEHG